VEAPASWTVERTLTHIRAAGHPQRPVYAVYVIDPDDRRLIHVVTLRELILAGHSGLFYSYADLLTEIRNTYNDSGSRKFLTDPDGNRWETESQILNHVINVDVLLLDELGKVKASEWVLDKVREIIGGRYDKKRTTLVTTNFPLDPKPVSGKLAEIPLQDKVGADTVSRLREMCHIVEMEGSDYRHIVKRQ